MIKGTRNILAAAALLACGIGSQAYAQGAQGCILLKSTAEVAQEVVDAKGVKTVTMVPAEKVVPGVEVTWTVTANNICKQPSDKVTINNAVPEHMTYVANSAMGPGSDVTYSLDGKTFGTPEQLTVKADGAQRQARSDEYRHIRWVFRNSLQPGAQAFARFRAVLN
jgi:uncharacterized repeat protein (TIGR01451 family)